MGSEPEGPKILLVDIETAPILGWSWQFYDTNLIDTLRDWSILSYAAKWLDEKPFVRAIDRPKSLFHFIQNPRNDEKIVRELWHLLDKADYVVAHNGQAFDCKKITSRFLYYNIPPPSPYKIIDTKLVTKRVSANTRNNQGVLLKEWGLNFKMENSGFPMWLGCMSGDKKSWKEMLAYNLQDTIGLESLYKHLIPWMKNNQGMFRNGTVCVNCGSHSLQARGWIRNKTTKYRRISCNDCGSWMRATENEQDSKPLVSI